LASYLYKLHAYQIPLFIIHLVNYLTLLLAHLSHLMDYSDRRIQANSQLSNSATSYIVSLYLQIPFQSQQFASIMQEDFFQNQTIMIAASQRIV